MKIKSLVCIVLSMLLLTGCGPKIQPPDDVIQQTTVVNQPNQPEWRVASCTYELSTGEIGSFKAMTSDGIAKIYSAPTTIYDADGEFIAVSDFKLPDEMKGVDFSQEGVLDALLGEVKRKLEMELTRCLQYLKQKPFGIMLLGKQRMLLRDLLEFRASTLIWSLFNG